MLALASGTALGQSAGCDSTKNPWAFVARCFGSALPHGDTVSLTRGLQQAVASLRSPQSLNPALSEFGRLTRTSNLIGSLHLNFVMVQQDFRQTLAMAYDWKRDLIRTPHKQGSAHGGVHAGLEARGLVSPNAAQNPEDFNEFVAHLSFFHGRGGATSPELMRKHLAALSDSAAAYRPPEAYLSSPAYVRYMASIWDSLSTQFYVTGGPEARYETDQGGEKTQWVVGARLGVDLKAWRPGTALARFNFFDWPAALVRRATGTDTRFRPSGGAIPTLSILLHNVAPGANAARDSVHNLDPYTRLAVELRSRSKLLDVADGPVWLASEFRHHVEIDSPTSIVDAGLHRHSRLQLQVELPSGFTLSWARGNFPLSEAGDDRWGIGFQFKYR